MDSTWTIPVFLFHTCFNGTFEHCLLSWCTAVCLLQYIWHQHGAKARTSLSSVSSSVVANNNSTAAVCNLHPLAGLQLGHHLRIHDCIFLSISHRMGMYHLPTTLGAQKGDGARQNAWPWYYSTTFLGSGICSGESGICVVGKSSMVVAPGQY